MFLPARRGSVWLQFAAVSAVANLLGLATSVYVIHVLNRYVAYGVSATLLTLTAGVGAAVGLEYAFRRLRLRQAACLAAGRETAGAGRAFALLAGVPLQQLRALPPGRRSGLVTEAERAAAGTGAPAVTALADLPFSLFFVAAIAALSPALGAVALGGLVLLLAQGAVTELLRRRAAAASSAVNSTRAALLGASVTADETVRAFNAAGHLVGLWDGALRETTAWRSRLEILAGRQEAFARLVIAAATVALYAVGAQQVVAGTLTVGALIGASILAARALSPAARLPALLGALDDARRAARQLREFAGTQPPAGRARPAAFDGRLSLADVAFAWPGSRTPLFEHLTVDLAPGEVLVVAGANGAGKSSLAKLIVGLVEPVRGQVCLDGIDRRQMAPDWWRGQIAYLPQEPMLLPGTLRDNLLVVNPRLDAQALRRLVEVAGLAAFVDATADGLDAAVVDCGRDLPVGIRRRFGLARALASGGRLAVFDEPTEGLDADGCRAVYGALDALRADGRTIVVCSHSPAVYTGTHRLLDLAAKPVPALRHVDIGGRPGRAA